MNASPISYATDVRKRGIWQRRARKRGLTCMIPRLRVGERGGTRLYPRGTKAPTKLTVNLIPTHCRVELFRWCVGNNPRLREGVVMRSRISTDMQLFLLHIGARSVRMDRSWFDQHGGTWEKEGLLRICCRWTPDGSLRKRYSQFRDMGRGVRGASQSGI